jgi:hypothetical protein
MSFNVAGLFVALTEPTVVAALIVRRWLLRLRVCRPGHPPTKGRCFSPRLDKLWIKMFYEECRCAG